MTGVSLRARLTVWWYCRLRGRCIVCGRNAPRWGDGFGVCDPCLGLPRRRIDDPYALADRPADEVRLLRETLQ